MFHFYSILNYLKKGHLELLKIDLNNIDETPICSNFPLSKGDLLRYLSKHVIFENCIFTKFATIKSIKAIDNLDSEYLKEFKIVLDPVLKQCEVSIENIFSCQFNF